MWCQFGGMIQWLRRLPRQNHSFGTKWNKDKGPSWIIQIGIHLKLWKSSLFYNLVSILRGADSRPAGERAMSSTKKRRQFQSADTDIIHPHPSSSIITVLWSCPGTWEKVWPRQWGTHSVHSIRGTLWQVSFLSDPSLCFWQYWL